MTVAHVIPLRRLPRRIRWLDYQVPTDMKILPGMLVSIPFLKSSLTGLVWRVDHLTDLKTLKSVSQIISPIPILFPWQFGPLERVSADHGLSVGELCQSFIPSFPRQIKWPELLASSTIKEYNDLAPKIWWYHNRPDILTKICAWITNAYQRPRIIVVPTLSDLEEYRRRLGSREIVYVHGAMTAVEQRRIFLKVLSGAVNKVIGTGRAMLLPYSQRPEILIDQEEHELQVQSAHFPYFDNRVMAKIIGASVIFTTPAPSLELWWSNRPSKCPDLPRENRVIGDLQHDRSPLSWLSNDSWSVIKRADRESPVLIIAPHPGYAAGLICRDCGYLLRCPTCDRLVGLVGPVSGGRCSFCQAPVAVPDSCPRCHSQKTSWLRPGASLISDELQRHLPVLKITSDPELSTQTDVIVLPYETALKLTAHFHPPHIIWPLIDRLRTWPDFSADERLWHLLWRLSAHYPSAILRAETHAPGDDFWVRWRQGEMGAWYQQEIAARQRWHIPPVYDQWIIGYRGPSGPDVLREKIKEIKSVHPKLSINILPARQPNVKHSRQFRAVITAPDQSKLDRVLNPITFFPPPWTIDRHVRRWR